MINGRLETTPGSMRMTRMGVHPAWGWVDRVGVYEHEPRLDNAGLWVGENGAFLPAAIAPRKEKAYVKD